MPVYIEGSEDHKKATQAEEKKKSTEVTWTKDKEGTLNKTRVAKKTEGYDGTKSGGNEVKANTLSKGASLIQKISSLTNRREIMSKASNVMEKIAKYSTWVDEDGNTHIYGAGPQGPYGTHPPAGYTGSDHWNDPHSKEKPYTSQYAGQSFQVPQNAATQNNLNLVGGYPKEDKPPATSGGAAVQTTAPPTGSKQDPLPAPPKQEPPKKDEGQAPPPKDSVKKEKPSWWKKGMDKVRGAGTMKKKSSLISAHSFAEEIFNQALTEEDK